MLACNYKYLSKIFLLIMKRKSTKFMTKTMKPIEKETTLIFMAEV